MSCCILVNFPWIVPVSGSGGVCVRAVAPLTGGGDVEVVGAGTDSGSGAGASPNVVTQPRTVAIHHRLLGQVWSICQPIRTHQILGSISQISKKDGDADRDLAQNNIATLLYSPWEKI